ncbi:MAG TPA: thiamine phosphate synthase, partial [Thermopetrobacter sp.]|nr:thiamine phosphate synthase [Thermopetrobacter sp.]
MRRGEIRLYVIVDPAACNGRDPVAVAQAAAAGGATIIQLRDKSGDIPALLTLARRMKEALGGTGVPLIINDRVDVALAAEADGAHVGQGDLPVREARLLLGERAILGLSHKTPQEVAASPVKALSYAAIGGIFPTTSKEQGASGLEAFTDMARQMRARAPALPIVGIAGITADNAASVIAAGADGVAVISAVCAADDPEAATRRLR